MSQGYLLCRPVGGLNDSLNQFEICCRYAAATGRIVLLDGRCSGFLDAWDKYFHLRESVEPAIRFYMPSLAAELNQMTCNPSCLTGRIETYTAIAGTDNCIDAQTGTPLRFNLTTAHPETLLVHHQYGGGILSFHALSKLQLRPEISTRVAALKALHPSYIALHVRNTDYQTDYTPLLEDLKKNEAEKILLCSDDARCKEKARSILGHRLFFATDTPDTGGKSLHANAHLDRWSENCNALIDLAMLSLANTLYVAPTTSGVYSGFSLLSNFLHHNRPYLKDFLALSSSP